jgi:hypothetical protein
MKKRYLVLSLVLFGVAGCGGPFSATERNIVKLFEEQHKSALDSSAGKQNSSCGFFS